MQFNISETKDSYDFPIPNKYFMYLEKRNVISAEYSKALKDGAVGILEENMLMIQDKPYCVNCILGASKDSIFDLIGTNDLYGLRPENGTAFATLHGDDFLMFKPNDAHVYYKSISTNNIVRLADSYCQLISMITFTQ